MIGFIGLGVMGEPMCRNLALKNREPILAFDLSSETLQSLAASGVRAAKSIGEVIAQTDIIFLSLPGGPEVQDVALSDGGLLAQGRSGQIIVDLGTSPVPLTKTLADAFAKAGVIWIDAPVARTREAAIEGTLSQMVGGDRATFDKLLPLFKCISRDITYCGSTGAGQLVKIVNNMVLTETVVAISEGAALAQAHGVDADILFEALSKGSADSFALRNHGMKSVLPGVFPDRAFSATYMLKDVSYALDLGQAVGVPMPGAEVGARLLGKAITSGYGAQYWPVISKLMKAEPANQNRKAN